MPTSFDTPLPATPSPSSSPMTDMSSSISQAWDALKLDVTHPSISSLHVNEGHWGPHALLDKTLNNWPSWSQHMILVLRLSKGLHAYINPKSTCPLESVEPRAHRNYLSNDDTVRAFILMKCADAEHPTIISCDTAVDMWAALQLRHEQQGPISQITLLQEAFAVRYSPNVPFSETTLIFQKLNKRIWDMGTPTPENFLCILMLIGLSSDSTFLALRDSVISGLAAATTSVPYTSVDIIKRLDFEQQCRAASKPLDALLVRGNTTSRSSSSSSTVFCLNCKKPHHTAKFCIATGGGMAGKTLAEAQLARQEERDRGRTKSKGPLNVIKGTNDRAYILDSDGQMREILVPGAPTDASVMPVAHFSDTTPGLHTDSASGSIDPLVAPSFCDADLLEYEAWLAVHDNLSASVDWRVMVERMHRTIMGKARAMRLQTNLPPNRWDEFCMTAGYLSARTPSRSCPSTPFEGWHSRKPDLSHLREIGSRAFALILNKSNPKIYARSVECILIGYSPSSKSYRLYNPSSHSVFESFHVKFIERQDTIPVPLNPGLIIDTPPLIPSPSISSSPLPTSNADFIPPPPPPALSPVLHRVTIEEEIDVDAPPSIPCAPVLDSLPRRSARIPIPTKKLAASLGIYQVPHVSTAVAASKTAARKLKEERLLAKDLRRRAVLDMRIGLSNPVSVPTLGSLSPAVPDSTLAAFSVEEEIGLFNEAFASHLAEPLLDTSFPDDPPSLRAALTSPDGDAWDAGIRDELKSLLDMGVYKLVPRSTVPIGRKVLRSKWVFRLKRDEFGRPVRHKARLVVKGFEQIFGQDYLDTTSPTARMESVRLLVNIAASLGWELEQVDIKTAFLYGLLPADEVQFMEQPEGYIEPGFEDHVWCLQRGLYGMKQSGRIWNKTMNKAMISLGFKRLDADPCVYYRNTSSGTVLTAVHVDDFLITASSRDAAANFKSELKGLWSISDLGEAKFCVGIAISRDRTARTASLSQTALIDRIISQFGQSDADPISTPMDEGAARSLRRPLPSDPPFDVAAVNDLPYRSLVGSLMYLAVGTRPDISFAVSKLCQFLDCYRRDHWLAAVRVVRYLKGTRNLSLVLGGSHALDLIAFSDSSFADCPDTRRSTMGFCTSLGGAVATWSARRQKTVTISSCEAEYIALSETSREILWLRQFLRELNLLNSSPAILLCDNNGSMVLAADPTHHSRSKHIDVKHHFIRERVDEGSVDLWRVPSADNLADIFTKPLPRPAFLRFRDFLGLR